MRCFFKFIVCLCAALGLSQTLFGQKNNGSLFTLEYKSLSERWEMDSTVSKGPLKVLAYNPVYMLFGNYTSDRNVLPSSDNPNNVVSEALPYEDVELKFQLSFKTRFLKKEWSRAIGVDFWLAYTQTSWWQLYSPDISRPFRETNYQPELIVIKEMPVRVGKLKWVYTGVSFNHQSNGRSNPISRSWNRVILHTGWELDDWSFIVKAQWRLPESSEDNDNPGMINYLGRADALVNYRKRRHNISVFGRHSLNDGNDNRGSVQLDYVYTIPNIVKLQLQFFHGYGESMIDFNHKQTTVGLGVSLIEW